MEALEIIQTWITICAEERPHR